MSKRGLKLRFLFATAYPESAGRSLLVANDILSLFFSFFFLWSLLHVLSTFRHVLNSFPAFVFKVNNRVQ